MKWRGVTEALLPIGDPRIARIRSTVLHFYSAEDVSSAKKVLLKAVDYIQLDKPL